MAIERVRVRAVVQIGDDFKIATPYVQSFSVRRQRGQLSSFSVAMKVSNAKLNESSNMTGGPIKIYAGSIPDNNPSLDNETHIPLSADILIGIIPLIYTGLVKSVKMSPCFDDPCFVNLSLSGTDVLSLLEGKRYTRRCTASLSAWAAITGVTRKGRKSDRLTYKGISLFSIKGDYSNIESDPGVVHTPNTVVAQYPGDKVGVYDKRGSVRLSVDPAPAGGGTV